MIYSSTEMRIVQNGGSWFKNSDHNPVVCRDKAKIKEDTMLLLNGARHKKSFDMNDAIDSNVEAYKIF